MCLDIDTLECIDYPKHETPPRFRTVPLQDIDRLTVARDSLFYPEVRSREIQLEVLQVGVYVHSAKPATIQKVLAFDQPIGASEGVPSRWAYVEVTNGGFHGRPITQAAFQRKINQQVPCCEGG